MPPPVHGAAVMNKIASKAIKSAYPESKLINISKAEDIQSVGKISFGKAIKISGMLLNIILKLTNRNIKFCYLNLHPTGVVFLRDAAICLISKAFKKKVILHIHGRGIPKKQSLIKNFIYKITFKNTEVIHLSDLFYEEVARFLKKDNFTSIPNCTDDRPDLKSTNQNKIIKFYYLSNYMKGKGALDLLEAAKHIYHKDIKCQFNLAGGWFDSSFKKEINQWKHDNIELFNSGYITINGPLYGEDRDNLIRSSDVFIFSSYIDTFPLVVLEALSAGKLIISTSTGATPEILANGLAGMLIPEKNYLALADKISYILNHPAIIKNFSTAARERYKNNYTEEIFTKNFTQTIKSIVRKNEKNI